MIRKALIFILFISTVLFSSAQEAVLDDYIQVALENNIALQQKHYSYAKSLQALKEAKRLFFPVISVEASYRMANGGRTAQIPFGQMLNPSYDNLDLINSTLAQTVPNYPNLQQYPEIEDFELNFLREKEHETKLQLQMPLFNASIIQNHKIKKSLTDIESISVDIYKRELVEDVKTAYIKYLQSEQMLKLYENTHKVVSQALKNRKSLYENSKITIDQVYAAEAQVKELEKDLAEATKNKALAIAWFNFLLNRDFEAEIQIDDLLDIEISDSKLSDLQVLSIKKREELEQLDKYIEINTRKIDLERGTALPEISLGASYGFQGTTYEFNEESDFAIVGVSLSWTLFNSGQRKAKIQQAQIDRNIMQSRKQEIERQIQMKVIESYYTQRTAKQSIELAQLELQNYQKSFALINKKYKQGMVNFLEYSNALNNQLNAENKLILAKYSYQIQKIELERLTSAYQFQ